MMNELRLLDSLFDNVMAPTFSSCSYKTPCVDVIENNDSYDLEMELPGRSENDVSIELDKDNLTITSKKEETKEKTEGKKYVLRERRTFDFTRRFTLPVDVDTDSIKANFKNGVLTINMQKKAVTSPKKIAIEAC